MLLTFAVPWVPTAKKNAVVIRTIRVRGRMVPKPVPSDRVRAEEHALSAIALVALAERLGECRTGRRERVTELARLRAIPGSGIGTKTLEAALAELRALPMPFDERDELRVEIVLEVGGCEREDLVHVEVSNVGERPRRGRTGRRRDVHNIGALVLDALQGTLYADDRQVAEVVYRRKFRPSRP